MPINETRFWTAACARGIADDCVGETTVSDVSSTAAAEKSLRDAGWRLGTRDTCARCMAAWEGEDVAPKAKAKPEPTVIPDTSASEDVVAMLTANVHREEVAQ